VPSALEQTRLRLAKDTTAEKKSRFGQFLTSAATAAFMAGLFPDGSGRCRLLDAGAGIGSLSAAFLERWKRSGFHFQRMQLDAFEIDTSLHPHLRRTMEQYSDNAHFTPRIWKADFIHTATSWLSNDLFSGKYPHPTYTHAILNPPYKKIRSDSPHRLALRHVGIETVNLYSAFVALALALVAPRGQIVAILPRSFCNGPYYRPFREFILRHAAIRHVHLFASRNRAFRDDAVLQENVIIRLERGATQGAVTVSTSTDDTFTDLATHRYPFEQIVSPDDPERFIHIPASPADATGPVACIHHTLADLGLHISTGPVVAFRLKEYLRDMPVVGTVPMLYPGHFSRGGTTWPLADMKKPNAILRNNHTEKWLYPSGFYCVVRRFSSKEEERRIVASVVDPGVFNGAAMLGFENHLNLFHRDRGGLQQALAYGLATFLNSTAVDQYFRRFSGHTQVNATDLRLMKYPSLDALTEIGTWATRQGELSQAAIDDKLQDLTE